MPQTYLKVIGRLTEQKKMKIRHSYLVQRNGIKPSEVKSKLKAKCIDSKGKIVSTTSIETSQYYLTKEVSKDLAVRAFIPITKAVKSVRFTYENKDILDMPVADTPPELNVDWKNVLSKQKGAESKRLLWKPDEKKSEMHQVYVEYSIDNGQSWRRMPHIQKDRPFSVDLEKLPGGNECKFAIVMSDGVLVSRSESPTFSNKVKPCIPMILSPAEGTVFKEYDVVELVGQGFYMEEQEPELEEVKWESSKDGLLGKGRIIEVKNLSKGEHTITLTAGKGRRAGKQSVTIKIVA